METKTKAAKLRIAVADGVARGWTSKETAYHYNLTVDDVRRMASKMKTSFCWARLGIPPRYTSEPVPIKTLFKRHRHTSGTAARKILKVVQGMDKSSKEVAELLKVVGFLRKRTYPEAWESRIKISQ